MTDRTALAKYLRGAATYHRHHASRVRVSFDALAVLKDAGVTLELPVSGDPGELTPDQAERYAEQLEGAR